MFPNVPIHISVTGFGCLGGGSLVLLYQSRGGPPQFCQITRGWATENQYFKKNFFVAHPPVLYDRSQEPIIWWAPAGPLYIENAVTRNKRRSRNQVASEWVKKISVRSWVELHFTTISYILSFNYSYRYEINLIRIMYTANSSILYSKEKTVRILGTWHQYLVNVSGLRYSKQIEFQEELINFLRTWLL